MAPSLGCIKLPFQLVVISGDESSLKMHTHTHTSQYRNLYFFRSFFFRTSLLCTVTDRHAVSVNLHFVTFDTDTPKCRLGSRPGWVRSNRPTRSHTPRRSDNSRALSDGRHSFQLQFTGMTYDRVPERCNCFVPRPILAEKGAKTVPIHRTGAYQPPWSRCCAPVGFFRKLPPSTMCECSPPERN